MYLLYVGSPVKHDPRRVDSEPDPVFAHGVDLTPARRSDACLPG